jgi:hypothetical protein
MLLLLLAALIGGTGLWLRAQQRQYALNRALIAALVKGDTRLALTLVNEGADPNTPYNPTPVPSLLELVKQLFHRSPPPGIVVQHRGNVSQTTQHHVGTAPVIDSTEVQTATTANRIVDCTELSVKDSNPNTIYFVTANWNPPSTRRKSFENSFPLCPTAAKYLRRSAMSPLVMIMDGDLSLSNSNDAARRLRKDHTNEHVLDSRDRLVPAHGVLLKPAAVGGTDRKA